MRPSLFSRRVHFLGKNKREEVRKCPIVIYLTTIRYTYPSRGILLGPP